MDNNKLLILTPTAQEEISKDKTIPKKVRDSLISVCNKNNVERACTHNELNDISYYDIRVHGKQYFVVFYKEDKEGVLFICFRIILSDFNSVKDFTKTCKKYLTKEEIDLINQIHSVDKQKERPILPESMKIDGKLEFKWQNEYVFEMDKWVHSILNYETKFSTIYDCLSDIIIFKKYEDYSFNNDDCWQIVKLKDLFIVFAEISHGERKYYYLFDIRDNNDIHDLKERYTLSYSELEHHCKKGYPCVMLCGDEKDWIPIEKDSEANLALSTDEIRLMSEVKYPLFINGLAGSGKSTILYYLFTNLFNDTKDKIRSLIFFSYNGKLIDKAKSIISALYINNALFSGQKIDNSLRQNLESCFKTFIDFLKDSFIESGEEMQRFASDKHLDFDLFCDLYLNKQPYKGSKSLYYKDKLIVVWSVIRSYIKGKFVDKEYTIDDYKKESVKTVKDSVFCDILKIYKDWYNKLEYWDDIDLVKASLRRIDKIESTHDYAEYYIARDRCEQSNLDSVVSISANEKHFEDAKLRLQEIIKYKYEVIFCDEAQDFTPVEVKLLLRLSPYAAFDLKDCNDKIPIVFAGDPNQTIIPTGFKWTNVFKLFQASFSENGFYVPINHEGLKINYRSQKSIVYFSNLIQYIRTELLKSAESVPQEVWNSDNNLKPVFVCWDMAFLDKHCGDFSYILTGQDGEYEVDDEGNLTNNSIEPFDDYLRKFKFKHKLYTSLSSKGLEFSKVMLYRFADALPDFFSKSTNSFRDFITNKITLDEVDNIKLSHFLTKLYIAISRTKDLLVIVDTKENFDRFWCCFTEHKDSYLFKDISLKWSNFINGIEVIDSNEISELERRLSENFDAKIVAKEFFDKGLFARSEKDMNKAARYYEEVHNYFERDKALAYALKFRHEYECAGYRFIQLNLNEEADKAFWEGKCWKQMIEFDNGVSGFVGKYMIGSISLIDFLKVDGIIKKFERTDDTWNDVVIKIKKDIAWVSEDYFVSLSGFISRLIERGYSVLSEDLGEILYKMGNTFSNLEYFERARIIWKKSFERISNISKSHYYHTEEVCAKTESEKIYWMYANKKIVEILTEYENVLSVQQLDANAYRIIFECLTSDVIYFDKALNFIFNNDRELSKVEQNNELEKLFSKYPVKFFVNYILKDISEDKFNDWVVDRVTRYNDLRLFSYGNLTKDFFDNVFKLDDEYLQTLFSLRDSNDERVIRKGTFNIECLLDSLSEQMTKKISKLNKSTAKFMAMCFVDFMFSDSTYSFIFYDKYSKILTSIMSNISFDKNDFMYSVTNTYSSTCNLSLSTIYTIHENVNRFIKDKLFVYANNKKNLSPQKVKDIKVLINFYKNVLPFDVKSIEKKQVDEKALNDFYNEMHTIYSFDKNVSYYLNIKTVIDKINKKTIRIRNLFKELKTRNIDFIDFCNAMNFQDSIMVLGYLLPLKYDETIEEHFVEIAKVIYTNDLTYNNLKNGKAVEYSKICIDKILSKNRLGYNDIYALKLLSYVREKSVDSSEDNAKFFADIQEKVSTNYREYFRRRALHHYAKYGNDEMYSNKAKEFGLSTITKNFSLKNERPLIDNDRKNSDLSYIPVKANDWIDDIEINVNIERHRVLFLNKGGDILLNINAGKPIPQSSSVKIELPKVIINSGFIVTIHSQNEVLIDSNGKRYRITM